MANQAEQACRPDGFPSASLAKMSQYGNWARSRVDALPPVFNRCKRIVTPAEEQHLLTAYLAATSSFSPDDDDDVTGKLKLAAEAAPWVAEPFVWLGLLALAHNELPSMAHSHGTRAKDILRAWNTPWDKRLSGIAWLSIAEWLSQTAGLSDDARRFLAHRLTRIFQCSASPVQSLYTQLDSRSSFSFTPAVALQQGEEPIDELFADRLQALPPRFADYALYFGEQLNPKMMNFYPDLEAKPWHDASTFELARDLERMAPEIIREFEALDKTKLHPETERIRREGSWDVFMLFERGKKRQENCALFPVTTSIIESHKTVRNLVGLVYFSRMAPGTIIAPHKGPTNMRLRCHLGIHVPKNCDITVDGITRTWQSGKCLVFDDSFNHEAKNLSDEERVVLIVDVWHPDLSDHEVALLSGLQRYIENTAQGLSGYWDRNESACLRDHR
jgi:aspartate beta-hydroxylase